MNDPMFVEVDYSIYDLAAVVTNDALSKPAKVMENLIQAPPGHPLYEYVDVSLVLSGSETADHVGVGQSTQHHHLLLQSLHLSLFLRLCVPRVAHLRRERIISL